MHSLDGDGLEGESGLWRQKSAGSSIPRKDLTGKCDLLRLVTDAEAFRVQLSSHSSGDVTRLQDYSNRTCLILAARANSPDVVTLLLEKFGKDSGFINHKDVVDCTALSYAAERGHTEVLELLLRAGADPALQDHFGNSAITWAAKRGRCGALKVLGRWVKSVEVWRAKGEDGLDARGWAVRMGRARAAELIGRIIHELSVEIQSAKSNFNNHDGKDGDRRSCVTVPTADSGIDVDGPLMPCLDEVDQPQRGINGQSLTVIPHQEGRENDHGNEAKPLQSAVTIPSSHSPSDAAGFSGITSEAELPERNADKQKAVDEALDSQHPGDQTWATKTSEPLILPAASAENTDALPVNRLTEQPQQPSHGQHPNEEAGGTDTDVESAVSTSGSVGEKRALVAFNEHFVSTTGGLPYQMQALDEAKRQLALAFRRCGFDVEEIFRPTVKNLTDDLGQMMSDAGIDAVDTRAAAVGILEFCRLDEQTRVSLLEVVSLRPGLAGKPKWIVDQGFAVPDAELHPGGAFLFSNSPGDLDTDGGFLTRELLTRLEMLGALDAGLDALMQHVVEAVKAASGQRTNPRFRNLLGNLVLF